MTPEPGVEGDVTDVPFKAEPSTTSYSLSVGQCGSLCYNVHEETYLRRVPSRTLVCGQSAVTRSYLNTMSI